MENENLLKPTMAAFFGREANHGHRKRTPTILPSPELVGFFGRDANHGYQEWLTMLRYVTVDIRSVVPIDLRVSPDQVLPYQTDFEKFPYCRYLMKKADLVEGMSGDFLERAGVITARPELMMIWEVFQRPADARYQKDVYFTVILFKGVLYLFHEKIDYYPNFSDMVHKFYQSMLSETPDGQPNTSETVKEVESFYGMFEMKLKNHKILYKSIIDGVLANSYDSKRPICDDDENAVINDLKKREFVKLKFWSGKNDPLMCVFKFHPKATSTLLQGFFSRVSKFYFGILDDYEIVKIKEYSLKEFQSANMRLCETCEEYFDCLDKFFDMIKHCFKREIFKNHMTTKFKNLPILSLKFKSHNNKFVLCHDSNPMELPEWYVNEMNRMM